MECIFWLTRSYWKTRCTSNNTFKHFSPYVIPSLPPPVSPFSCLSVSVCCLSLPTFPHLFVSVHRGQLSYLLQVFSTMFWDRVSQWTLSSATTSLASQQATETFLSPSPRLRQVCVTIQRIFCECQESEFRSSRWHDKHFID